MSAKTRILAAATIGVLTLSGAASALAENHRNTYMKDVAVGFESRTWTDEGNDSQATSIQNTGCSLSYPMVHAYQNHNLQLKRKVGLFWRDHGAKQSNCSTVTWGRAIPGVWKFRVSQVNNGNIESYQRLTVNAVVIKW